MKRKAVSRIRLALLLVGVLIFAFNTQPSREFSAYFKIVTEEYLLTTDKASYNLGEEVKISFTNYSNKTAYFPCDPPFQIIGPPGLVYPAFTFPYVVEVPSGASMQWTWDQLNYFTGLPVPPGKYSVHLSVYNETFGLETELWTFFTIGLAPPDIAVTNVILSKTVVGQGFSVFINATVENQGGTTEAFSVTAYADLNTTVIGDEVTIGTESVTLFNGASKTITFTWDTTGVVKGNYTISTYAWPVPGETDTADNTYVDGIVTVAMKGDITGPKGVPDGIVDIFDLVMIAKRFGEIMPPIPPPVWPLPPEDINGNGVIDIFDLVVVAMHFGETDP